jgi:hypothetical protein
MADRVIKFAFRGDASQLQTEVRKGSEELRGFEKSGVASAKAVGKALAGFGAAAAAAMAVAATAAIKVSANLNKIAKDAKRVGSTVTELQQLQRTLDRVTDGSANAAETAKFLGKNLADVRGGAGEAAKQFGKLGLDINRVLAMPVSEQVRTIAGAFPGLRDEAEQTQVALALFGRAGSSLVAAFRDGGADFDAAAARVAEIGVAGEGAAERAETLQDALGDASQAANLLAVEASDALFPALTDAANVITSVMVAAANDQGLREFVRTIGEVTAGAVQAAAALFQLDTDMALPEGQRLGKQIGQLQGEIAEINALFALTSDLTQENAGDFLSLTASMGLYGTIAEREAGLVEMLNEKQTALAETEEASIRRTRELIAAREAALAVDVKRNRATSGGGGAGGGGGGGGAGASPVWDESSAYLDAQASVNSYADTLLARGKEIVQAAKERREAVEAEAEAEAKALQGSVDSLTETVGAAVTQATQMVLDGVMMEVQNTKDEIAAIEDEITKTTDKGAKERLLRQKKSKEKELEEEKKAAMAAWVMNKIAAIAQAGVSMALGIANSLSMGMPQGAVMAAISAVAGGAAMAAITAQPPPSFHAGGLVTGAALRQGNPDDIPASLRAGEFVSTPAAVSRLGRQTLEDAERGRLPSSGGEVVVRFNDRDLDVMHSSRLRAVGSPLQRATASSTRARYSSGRVRRG